MTEAKLAAVIAGLRELECEADEFDGEREPDTAPHLEMLKTEVKYGDCSDIAAFLQEQNVAFELVIDDTDEIPGAVASWRPGQAEVVESPYHQGFGEMLAREPVQAVRDGLVAGTLAITDAVKALDKLLGSGPELPELQITDEVPA